jgi:hypothetical protein
MNYQILKRTFEALKYGQGTPKRMELNKDALTSEYFPSSKWLLRVPFIMSDGTPHPTQKYLDYEFRTKKEAKEYAEEGFYL